MRLPVNPILPLAASLVLGGCAAGTKQPIAITPRAQVGPEADYPVVVGAPFVLGDRTYTPVDTMNYDAVGRAVIDDAASPGVSGAHKTLPLPSYVEVTNLDTGRTVLVRLDRRGPMRNDALIALSPGAVAQLGASGMGPVRVRRVNPPEPDRALLRSGEAAAARIDTPASLLGVLRRKLAQMEPGAAPAVPVPAPPQLPKPETPREGPVPVPEVAVQTPATKPAGKFHVQVGAFSARERADKVAAAMGGNVSKPGALWVVRMGPYASPAQANAALEKARRAGYGDAMVKRTD